MTLKLITDRSFSTTTFPGLTELSVAPASATVPIAVGTNDLRMAAGTFSAGDKNLLTINASGGLTAAVYDPQEISHTFSYGDATPYVLYTMGAVKTVSRVLLSINTPINGAAPSITVGDNSVSDSLMASTTNLPGVAGSYETTPMKSLPLGATVLFSLVPGSGASSGTGEVKIFF